MSIDQPAPKLPVMVGLTPSSVILRIRRWRGRLRASPGWTVVAAALVAVLSLPIAAILWLALGPGSVSAIADWPHLIRNVLPRAFYDTAIVMAGVGTLTFVIGAGTAWLVTMYQFPGRAIVDRLLVVPLAMPTYIIAYCYVELLDYAGPAQSALRVVFGWSRTQDYWFPEIRSLPGAVWVIAMVLYPYVYLSARASFVQQSICALEVARTLGRTPMGVFWSVALPLARPAIAAGIALALMECLNDLGAMQHLGIQTLSVSIYTTWQQRGSLIGASQIAVVMLMVVAVLFIVERRARGLGRISSRTDRYRAVPFAVLEGGQGVAALAICLLPFLLGFLVPCLVLLRHAIAHAPDAIAGGFLKAAWNSVSLAVLSALIAVVVALVLVFARRVAPNGFTRPATSAAGLGYALPGTVLAIGVMIPFAGFDNWLDAIMRSTFGVSTGLLLSGSIAALTFAYTVRFLSVALGSIDAGMERISPNLDAAARTLGLRPLVSLARVHIPLLIPALGAAGLLVFVDAMKELPATLLMRPFNFETLATQVYNFAALEQFEQASLGALAIVAVGLAPVLLLHQAIAGGRAGSG